MINSFTQFLVEEEKVVYFAFGRMNPPTIGHGKLMDKLASVAGKNPYFLYLSQSNDAKNNPVDYNSKVKFIRKMFPKHARQVLLNKKVKTPFDALTNLYDQGYRKVIMVAGSDRVDEYKIRLNKYNASKGSHGFYNFKDGIQIVSAGQRDPDSAGAEGASGTKQRQFAKDNNFTKFSQGLPKAMSNADAKELFNAVRRGMGLKEEKQFRNHIKLEPVSDIRESYLRNNIFKEGEQVVMTKKGIIGNIKYLGTNYLIVESKGETWRCWLDDVSKVDPSDTPPPHIEADYGADPQQGPYKILSEAYEIGTKDYVLHLAKGTPGQYPANFDIKGEPNKAEVGEKTTSPQDPDIKDRKGTQPKGYYGKDASGKEMSKSTKIARNRHFKKGAKMDDDNPAAYKKAPGDHGAKTKPSKHTLKFKQMYGEDAIKIAKARIDREKESDALKHDRMLDRARLAKARAKNRSTKP